MILINSLYTNEYFFFLVSTSTALGIVITATVFVVSLIFATCYCFRRRRRAASHLAAKLGGAKPRHSSAGVAGGVNQPLAWNTHRKPTAVKSPAGGNPTTHYLKKSPSPTGTSKSPPGVSNQTIIIMIFFKQIFF